MISYGLLDILRQRAGQASFHVASERAIRVEFMRFAKGQELGPLKFEGDIVITCLEGAFAVGDDGTPAAALTQVIVPEGESLRVRCSTDAGALQIIWAPPFAMAKPV
jgi:hypothetical protein